jgi:DNA (cytosine-5)-methyltransferase 1
MQKWKPVKEVLDLLDEGKSIFEREKPLCEKTLERIYAGLVKFVANGDESFISKYYSGKPEGKNISLNGPAGTIKTVDGQAVVFISKYNSAKANGDLKNGIVSVDNPAPTITTQNRISVVQAFLQQYHGKGVPVSIEGPSTTITTKDRLSLVQPVYMVNYYSSGGQLSDVENPCPAITSVPKQRLVTPQFLDQQYGNSKPAGIEEPAGALTSNPKLSLVSLIPKWLMDTSFNNKGTGLDEPAPTLLACRKHHYLVNPQYNSAGSSIENPCFTLIAKMDKRPPSIITAETGETSIVVYNDDSYWTTRIKIFMAEYGIIDIKMRMLKISEMLRIMGFGDNYKLAGTQTDQKKFIGNAVHTIIPQRWYEAMAMNNLEKKEAV